MWVWVDTAAGWQQARLASASLCVLLLVCVQVCECLILFMEKNEEEFAKFLQTFVQDVWTQLMAVSQRPGQVRGVCGGGGGARRETLVVRAVQTPGADL